MLGRESKPALPYTVACFDMFVHSGFVTVDVHSCDVMIHVMATHGCTKPWGGS